MSPRPWTEEEKAVVAANPEMEATVLAEKLNRTYQSVANMRRRIDGVHKGQVDTDKRPSGWYDEVVGTLLLAYEDAYSTWKHYHRYVEVKVVGENALGWTTLVCRRDAETP